MSDKQLTVCYFGTYRANYARNQYMIAGLRAVGVNVIECQVSLWHGVEDRVQVATGKWANLSFIRRLLVAYKQLLTKYRTMADYDVMVLGHPGQLDVFLARLLTWLQHKPLVLDLLLSIYLVSLERGLAAKSPVSIKFLRLLEAIACRLPDFLICETEAYVQWHVKTHHLKVKKFGIVPVIADSRTFQPVSPPQLPNNDKFNVLYYGTYIPNHGVETIIKAANLLRDHPDIQFEMVGQGPTKTKAEELVNQYQLKNVVFTNWLEKEALPEKITQADIVLGIFGTTLHSQITLHNKIHESLALGKAVITRDSPAIQEAIQPGVHAYLVEAANPKQLAEGILNLQADPRLRELLGQQGQTVFRQKYSLENLGQQFKRHLLALIR